MTRETREELVAELQSAIDDLKVALDDAFDGTPDFELIGNIGHRLLDLEESAGDEPDEDETAEQARRMIEEG